MRLLTHALSADVRMFDHVRPCASFPRARLLAALRVLDIWNLRSFCGQSRRDAAWNAATRLLPCLHWLAQYKPRKQLGPDIAAGIAVTFLIVPQGLSYAGVAGLPAIYGLCALLSCSESRTVALAC